MLIFIQRIKDALKWVAALQLTAQQQYNAALDKLDEINGMQESVQPTLLRALIYLELGQYNLAQDNADVVISRLSEHTTDNTVLYMIAYANWIGGLADARRNIEKTKYLSNYFDVDLKKVSNDIKRKFPLREHPKWT